MRRLLALCAVVTLVGCNSTEDPDVGFVLPPTDANVAGTFALASANGFVPPFDVVVNTQERWTLVRDRIFIQDDQTWVDSTDYHVERAGGLETDTTTSSAGTYNIAEQHINFTMTVGGSITFQGAVVADTLSVSNGGRLYRYLRPTAP
jgi:hypothetical protein